MADEVPCEEFKEERQNNNIQNAIDEISILNDTLVFLSRVKFSQKANQKIFKYF